MFITCQIFLVFAAWYPKLTGTKLILDIHDVVPELFANKFRTNFKSIIRNVESNRKSIGEICRPRDCVEPPLA